MNVLIVGASAGLGRALAEEGARLGHNLLLVATDARDLASLQSDLTLRYQIRTAGMVCDLSDERNVIDGVVHAAELFGTDGIMFPVGVASDHDTGTLDEAAALRLMNVNFVKPSSIIAKLWPVLARRQSAFVTGFGSVAAIRGRSRNVVYSAAKRALTSYFESLCHMSTRTNIAVQLYQMGFIETQQTFGKKLLFPACTPSEAARYVWAKHGETGLWFFPAFWGLIDTILRSIPLSIYRKLDF
jgi:short-subunit dehydrogenase